MLLRLPPHNPSTLERLAPVPLFSRVQGRSGAWNVSGLGAAVHCGTVQPMEGIIAARSLCQLDTLTCLHPQSFRSHARRRPERLYAAPGQRYRSSQASWSSFSIIQAKSSTSGRTCRDSNRAPASVQPSTIVTPQTPSSPFPWTTAVAVAAAAACVALATFAPETAHAASSSVAVLTPEELAEACSEELGGADLNTVIVVACIVEFIGLTGAAVGGYVARLRKQEVERINAQLRQINVNLRKQARVESYAPALSYAPVGQPAAAAAAAAVAAAGTAVAPDAPAVEDAPAAAEAAPAAPSVPGKSKEGVVRLLKAGKQQLRNANPTAAFREFEKALKLAREIGDVIEEKKAARGCGASCQRQGKYEEAIKYHQLVLDRSNEVDEHAGVTEAYGAIADCYAELGDLEAAAKFYDRYIMRLEDD